MYSRVLQKKTIPIYLSHIEFIKYLQGLDKIIGTLPFLVPYLKNSVSSKILIRVSLFWYIFTVDRLFLLLNCVFSIIFQI